LTVRVGTPLKISRIERGPDSLERAQALASVSATAITCGGGAGGCRALHVHRASYTVPRIASRLARRGVLSEEPGLPPEGGDFDVRMSSQETVDGGGRSPEAAGAGAEPSGAEVRVGRVFSAADAAADALARRGRLSHARFDQFAFQVEVSPSPPSPPWARRPASAVLETARLARAAARATPQAVARPAVPLQTTLAALGDVARQHAARLHGRSGMAWTLVPFSSSS
jgi:hypothetical protein